MGETKYFESTYHIVISMRSYYLYDKIFRYGQSTFLNCIVKANVSNGPIDVPNLSVNQVQLEEYQLIWH